MPLEPRRAKLPAPSHTLTRRSACVTAAIVLISLLTGPLTRADDATLRIVSLSPALTRIVIDLGLSDSLVGVGQHDTQAPAGLAVVGNFTQVDHEKLLSVQPTHVLFPQTVSTGPDALAQRSAGRFAVCAVSYPTTIDEVLDSILAVGSALGVAHRAQSLRTQTRERLDAVRAVCEQGDAPPPSVLLAFSTSPMWASGPGSVNDGLLALVGVRNVLAGHVGSAVTLDAEALVALSPSLIVLLRPGDPPLLDLDADARLEALRGLPDPALVPRRFVLLNSDDVLLPATNLPWVASALAQAVWPDRTAQLRELERGWQ